MINPTKKLKLDDGVSVSVVSWTSRFVEVVLDEDVNREGFFIHPVLTFDSETGESAGRTKEAGETRKLVTKG